jgi:hypothetical protein
VVVGTPDYLAPEAACEPSRADIRSDLYGLGCTFWFLLTGQPPFPAPTVLQKLLAHQERSPGLLTQRRPDVPEELARVVERLLAKDPARRYQTPAEVVRALAPFTGAGPAGDTTSLASPKPPSRSRLRRWLLLTGGLIAACLLALVFWLRPWEDRRPRDTHDAGGNQNETTPEAIQPELATPEQVARMKKERLEQAAAWARANNRWGPEHMAGGRLVAKIEDQLAEADAFRILLGGALLKSGKPALLAGNPGGFFAFDLTSEQARELDLPDGVLRCWPCSKLSDRYRPAPRLLLSDLHFDAAPDLDPDRPTAGSVTFKGPLPEGRYALRLSHFPDGRRRSQFLYPGKFSVSGDTVSFAFPSLHAAGTKSTGPLVLFLDVCSFTEREGRTVVESDCVADLVRVLGSGEKEK